ncbi:MAG: hypothetical protein WCE62_21255 [Polyangiales bacterium]
MTGPRQRPRTLFSDSQGIVFLEFLIAFVPLWTFFLCMVQLAFIAHANLLVKHSADSAARSAVVVLPDDPNEYGGEPEMSVDRNPLTASDIAAALGRLGSGIAYRGGELSVGSALSDEILVNLGRSRLNTIRLAAHVPVMPLAPANVGYDSRPSIAKAIGGAGKLVSALYYQPFALAVTFPQLAENLGKGSEITVRVTYAYQCTVPLARRLLCQTFQSLGESDALGDAFLPLVQSLVGGRFRALQHETTLLIHDAPYEYRVRG